MNTRAALKRGWGSFSAVFHTCACAALGMPKEPAFDAFFSVRRIAELKKLVVSCCAVSSGAFFRIFFEIFCDFFEPHNDSCSSSHAFHSNWIVFGRQQLEMDLW